MAPGPTTAATSGLPPRGDLAGRRHTLRTSREGSIRGDGNGWVQCALGHRHWGRFGAAGLLITDGAQVLLQHRAPWTHEGGTWAVPGGARDSHEDPIAAALREAAEETDLDPDSIVAARRMGGRARRLVLHHDRRAHRPGRERQPHQPREHRDPVVADRRRSPALPLHHGFAARLAACCASCSAERAYHPLRDDVTDAPRASPVAVA